MDDLFGLVGRSLDGKYEIDAAVAKGGFGVVYRGRQLALNRTVAVKVLNVPAEFNDAARRLFMDGFAREAQVVAQLDHPAIVRVLDFGISPMPGDGLAAPWMVLEWVAGSTLGDHLRARRGGPGRSPAEALELLRPVLDAVAYAHEQGIAHRDLKPANVMLMEAAARRGTNPGSSGSGRQRAPAARLLDFGIAKIMEPGDASVPDATRTSSNALAFSLLYAAVEQVNGMRTGPWTDVHALGLILTELLTDTPPFSGASKEDVFDAVISSDRPTPARFGFDVGPWEPVLARAVARKVADRFPNAGELFAALEAAVPSEIRRLEGVPTATVPLSMPARPPIDTGSRGSALPGAVAPAASGFKSEQGGNSTLRPATMRTEPVAGLALAQPKRSYAAVAVAAALLVAVGFGATALVLTRTREASPARGGVPSTAAATPTRETRPPADRVAPPAPPASTAPVAAPDVRAAPATVPPAPAVPAAVPALPAPIGGAEPQSHVRRRGRVRAPSGPVMFPDPSSGAQTPVVPRISPDNV